MGTKEGGDECVAYLNKSHLKSLLKTVISRSGKKIDTKKLELIDKIINEADKDNNDEIDPEEFQNLMRDLHDQVHLNQHAGLKFFHEYLSSPISCHFRN